MTIISGGQTGVGRVARDVAMELGIPVGGTVNAGMLNVAGPRASGDPAIGLRSAAVMLTVLIEWAQEPPAYRRSLSPAAPARR